MGYPGKNHKQYQTPKRPFEASRIEEETKIVIEYGLRNKREVWIAKNELRRYRKAAREIIALASGSTDTAKTEVKKDQLLGYLKRMNILSGDVDVDDVLSLQVSDQLGRRLQTLVYRKGLARSPKQARQFITHGHITVNGKKVTIPGYLVNAAEEDSISYHSRSNLMSDIHAERKRIAKVGR